MCGIVGYISNTDKLYEQPKDHFMRFALSLDTLRGEDSTGLITLNKRFSVSTLKTLMPGDVFVHSQEYKKKYRPGWAQIGHNRAATRGTVNIDNAHPFQFGDVTLVHNGTLWQSGASIKTFDKSLEVDSMQIAYALSQHAPEKAAEVLSSIDGSFAIVWTDRRDESVNMARNSERPIHFTFNAQKTIMWYMSDGHHLHSINKSFGNHECKGQSIFEMDRQKILKFKKGTLVPEVTPFLPFARPVYVAPTPTKTKATTQVGGKSSALERATEQWNRNLAANGPITGTGAPDGNTLSSQKILLQGKKRKIPSSMQLALHSELYLNPDDLLQFNPKSAVEMRSGKFVVYGNIVHVDWNIEWEATLYNVAKIQWNAYKDGKWLVRPVGVAPPHVHDPKNVAVLCDLVHCDWQGYLAAKVAEDTKSADADKEADSTSNEVDTDMWVPGVQGRVMRWSRLRPMLENGCIECGKDLMHEPLMNAIEVNECRDIVCEECVQDMSAKLRSGTTPTIN